MKMYLIINVIASNSLLNNKINVYEKEFYYFGFAAINKY